VTLVVPDRERVALGVGLVVPEGDVDSVTDCVADAVSLPLADNVTELLSVIEALGVRAAVTLPVVLVDGDTDGLIVGEVLALAVRDCVRVADAVTVRLTVRDTNDDVVEDSVPVSEGVKIDDAVTATVDVVVVTDPEAEADTLSVTESVAEGVREGEPDSDAIAV
jgi:hypothetical protein